MRPLKLITSSQDAGCGDRNNTKPLVHSGEFTEAFFFKLKIDHDFPK